MGFRAIAAVCRAVVVSNMVRCQSRTPMNERAVPPLFLSRRTYSMLLGEPWRCQILWVSSAYHRAQEWALAIAVQRLLKPPLLH